MSKARGNGFLRAKIRHAVLTRAADRLSFGVLGRRHRRQAIEVRSVELRSPRWPARWDGVRIAHLTDFHLGHLMEPGRAVDAIARLSLLRPDMVACTGDVVDLELEGAEPVLEAMGAVEAPLGRWLVLGNHDHLDDPRSLVSMASACGIETLHGEVRAVGGGRDALRVGGVDWGRTMRILDRSVDALPEVPDLLLSHNPKAFHAAARRGVAITLSGHTHGGQVAFPGRPKANISFAHRLTAGTYARAGCTLFVSVGAGAWFPLRVHCAPEVVLVTVRRG
jgi:hypothetical protein